MAFYIQIVFIAVCLGIGLGIGDGRFAEQADPSLAFLFRAWGWPAMADLPLFIGIGLGAVLSGVVQRVRQA